MARKGIKEDARDRVVADDVERPDAADITYEVQISIVTATSLGRQAASSEGAFDASSFYKRMKAKYPTILKRLAE